jgi:hypothetical protein
MTQPAFTGHWPGLYPQISFFLVTPDAFVMIQFLVRIIPCICDPVELKHKRIFFFHVAFTAVLLGHRLSMFVMKEKSVRHLPGDGNV